MNDEHDLPSDSDDSDVDFVPEGLDSSLSEEDTDENVEDETSEKKRKEEKTKRKKKSSDRKRKKIKASGKNKENDDDPDEDDDEAVDEDQQKKTLLSAEEEKKKSDALWADFMKDCNPPVKKETIETNGTKATVSSNGEVNSEAKVDSKTEVTEPVKKTVKQIFEFAGEKIEVERECTSQSPLPTTNARGRGGGNSAGPGRGRGGGGIASILGQIGKKNKLSTLEKSKLDWDRFKKDEGIEEQLQTVNKGKAGYLEKQDFLERADLRQFEIEKQLRTTRRSNR